MAKSPTPPAPPPPPAPPAPAGDWDMGLDIPAARGFGGAKGGVPGADWNMEAMPVNASKLIEVTFPDGMNDQAARDAHFEAEQKKIANRVASTIRRFREYENGKYKSRNFAVRKVADEKYGYGVRFWRIADEAAK